MALITGAASSTGASVPRIFARKGAKVVAADLLDGEGEKVVADITQANGVAVPLSRRDQRAEWKAAADAMIAEFGELDILVNDAGTP